ncbi:hypothetical protein ES703_70322 [subsurface metagenome]
MKTTGLVFSMRSYTGEVSPPATVLEDESRYGSNGDFKSSGHPTCISPHSPNRRYIGKPTIRTYQASRKKVS